MRNFGKCIYIPAFILWECRSISHPSKRTSLTAYNITVETTKENL